MKVDEPATARREEWLSAVRELTEQIKIWCAREGWLVDEHPRRIEEESLGSYEASELFVKAPGGRVTVEPVAGDIVGADGRVDICAFPSFARMLLIRRDGRWIVHTDSRVEWPEPWGRDAFLGIVRALVAA